MNPTKEQAARGLEEAFDNAGNYKLDAPGRQWTLEYFDGEGRDGESREEILASEKGEDICRAACQMVRRTGGPLLDFLAEEERRHARSREPPEYTRRVLSAYAIIASASGTRLCNGFPPP